MCLNQGTGFRRSYKVFVSNICGIPGLQVLCLQMSQLYSDYVITRVWTWSCLTWCDRVLHAAKKSRFWFQIQRRWKPQNSTMSEIDPVDHSWPKIGRRIDLRGSRSPKILPSSWKWWLYLERKISSFYDIQGKLSRKDMGLCGGYQWSVAKLASTTIV